MEGRLNQQTKVWKDATAGSSDSSHSSKKCQEPILNICNSGLSSFSKGVFYFLNKLIQQSPMSFLQRRSQLFFSGNKLEVVQEELSISVMKEIQSKFCSVLLEEQNGNEWMEYDLYITVGFIFSNLTARSQPKLAGSCRFLYCHLKKDKCPQMSVHPIYLIPWLQSKHR